MNNVFDIINDVNKIVLLTHENPDGDAIGSTLALYKYLLLINKDVDMIIPEIPFSYKNLPDIDKRLIDSNKEYDLGIILDCATKERIGVNSNILDHCKKTLVIDHHISNTSYGEYNIVDGSNPATCQLLYELFRDNNIKISKDIMSPLAIGIITDTGGFQNSNTNAKTFNIMNEMMIGGVNIPALYREYFSKNSIEQFNLHRLAIERMEFFEKGKIVFTYITMADYDKTNAPVGSHEGIVDIGKNIYGVEVSIFARESESGYRISLRSNDYVNVSTIASTFNGGGHINAAGCTINKSLKETKETLINEVKKYINE